MRRRNDIVHDGVDVSYFVITSGFFRVAVVVVVIDVVVIVVVVGVFPTAGAVARAALHVVFLVSSTNDSLR